MITPYGLKIARSTNNKFGAKKTEYNGQMYDSTAEAVFARTLDRLRLASESRERVIEVETQVKFDFHVNGEKMFTYILDFKVTYANGAIKYFDVKGLKKGAAYDLFRIKSKCISAQHGIIIEEA